MPVKLLVLAILFILPMVPTFWAIVDIPKRRFSTRKKKIGWFVLAASVPCVGGLAYLLFVRRHTEPAAETDRSLL